MSLGIAATSSVLSVPADLQAPISSAKISSAFSTVFDAVELVPIEGSATNSSLRTLAKSAEAALQASLAPIATPTGSSMVEAIHQMAHKTAVVSVATTGLTLATMASTSVKKNMDLVLNQR